MKLVITDLDNTLYDWVEYFANSFSAMVDELIPILEIERDELLKQFKQVHQSYSNSEQPFAVLELPCVQERFHGESTASILEHLSPALRAFNSVRNERLQLYPGVRSALEQLKASGVSVVGHTEATVVNAYYRLRKLGIAQHLDQLYALRGRLSPHPVEGRGELHVPPTGFVTSVPTSERKPNPALLTDICRKQGISPSSTVYIGDSLTRDMSMARRAGVLAVWAKYGTQYDQGLWSVLVKITHWTDEDVAREARLKQIYRDIKPDVTIHSFEEVLPLLETQPEAQAAAG